MKRQIRLGIFETNSSSTHCLVLSSERELKDWKDGKLILEVSEGNKKLVPVESVKHERKLTYEEFKSMEGYGFEKPSWVNDYCYYSDADLEEFDVDGTKVYVIQVDLEN